MKFSVPKLKPEVDRWVAEGVISADQAGRILARYPAEARSYWLTALAVIGSVLCLGGVILLIASNWQAIPSLVKLAGLLILLIGSTTVAIETQRRGLSRAAWECGYLGASVFPLLGLSLISQIFHLDGRMSDLLLVWLLAILPLPFLSLSASAYVVGILALAWTLGVMAAEGVWAWTLGWDFRDYCLMYLVFGVLLAAVSQGWRLFGKRLQCTIGEFVGVAVAGLSAYLMAFDITHWFALWTALFAACLGLIYWGYRTARIHQVNFAFVMIALVLLSTFIRLVGTMAKTGTIFLAGGIFILTLSIVLNRIRRKMLAQIQ